MDENINDLESEEGTTNYMKLFKRKNQGMQTEARVVNIYCSYAANLNTRGK
jgi:hypothetical protein